MNDVLQRVWADMLEETSPEVERRIRQAIEDINKELKARLADLTTLEEKRHDVSVLLKEMNNGHKRNPLLVEFLERRDDRLRQMQEELNLSKLHQKKDEKEGELERMLKTRGLLLEIMEDMRIAESG